MVARFLHHNEDNLALPNQLTFAVGVGEDALVVCCWTARAIFVGLKQIILLMFCR
jgi:hypothetical protein